MTKNEFISNVKSTQKAVRRFLTALCCGDSFLADDLAQDTFMKAYLACDDFRGGKFSSWIYRIAYNTFLSHCRSQKPTESITEAEYKYGADDADAQFRYQALYLALDRLSEKERVAILLFYMEGYDVKEISKITGSSPESIRQQLSRGRQHLKALLEK